MPKLREIGEEGAWRAMKPFVASSGRNGVVVGFGDDTAAVEIPPGSRMLMTSDMLVEGVHFRPEFTSWRDLGRKAIAVNVSDIASMGGSPAHALVSIGLPPEFGVNDLKALYRGMASEAARHGAALVGGDTVRASEVVINVALTGFVPRKQSLALRSNCRNGQTLYLSGPVGDSAAGLALLASRRLHKHLGEPWARKLIRRHRLPVPRLELGQQLASTCGDLAMIDVSDALEREFRLLADASSATLEIDVERIPLSPALKRFCEVTHQDPLAYALGGGEDYELLFSTRHPVSGATAIGRVIEGQSAVSFSRPIPPLQPFEHF